MERVGSTERRIHSNFPSTVNLTFMSSQTVRITLIHYFCNTVWYFYCSRMCAPKPKSAMKLFCIFYNDKILLSAKLLIYNLFLDSTQPL
jgi:hypothetical protein